MEEVDYSPLIELISGELGKYCERVEHNEKVYYITQHWFVEDNNPSMQIFTSGYLHSYNGDIIDGQNRIFIKNAMIQLGYLNLYIEFILNYHKIPTYKLNQYREILIQDKNDIKLKKMFYSVGIYKQDILGINYVKPINSQKFTKTKKVKPKKEIKDLTCTTKELSQALEYMNSRKLEVSKNCCPRTLQIGEFKTPCITFYYPSGFKKYRLIGNSKLRYLTNVENGGYTDFFEAQVVGFKKALLIEGECESLSLSQCILYYDIYAMHNVNSICKTEQLKKYDEVIVLIDKDKFYSVNMGLYKNIKNICNPNCKITLDYKFEDTEMDFNKFLVEKNIEELENYLLTRI